MGREGTKDAAGRVVPAGAGSGSGSGSDERVDNDSEERDEDERLGGEFAVEEIVSDGALEDVRTGVWRMAERTFERGLEQLFGDALGK